ncbi:uncharacterized protein LOC131856454 [Cryptomeria japonica]|uniref:uncharacterized protein LOC131856454 n=1 Tax=Cryptomeria japonica TaxID=3369 RepID=UPI0027DA7182|nr:uncharacterized protein LOC131856454 [Cryptomeria japonica]
MSEKEAFKWNEAGRKAFKEIKKEIAHAPTLVNPDFNKDFIIYCYASEHTMSGILVQKGEDNEEVLIFFMSIPLKKHELKYSQIEKRAYAVVKAMKQFRASWVSKIQEFNLDIKPTKLFKGQGLCRLMAENESKEDDSLPLTLFVDHQDSSFTNVAYYLTYGDCPNHISPREKRNLRLKAAKYVISHNILYKKGLDGTFLRCVDKPHQEALLKTFHNEACGGHFSSTITTYKILRNCYYWPGMFWDAYAWVARCEKCKLFTGKPQLVTFPLRPVVIEEPFKQWGLDFIGPLNPISSVGHTHILTATEYFTKWVEAIPVKNTTSEIVCTFLKENILIRFGVPQKIVTGNASNFSSSELRLFFYDDGIVLAHASDYYPQGNGQAESSNKNLINIMRKLVSENFRDWHKKLHEALWADQTSPKRAIGMSPFELVYGIGAQISLPLELAASKLQTVHDEPLPEVDWSKNMADSIQTREAQARIKEEKLDLGIQLSIAGQVTKSRSKKGFKPPVSHLIVDLDPDETPSKMTALVSEEDKVSIDIDAIFQDLGALEIQSHIDHATPPPSESIEWCNQIIEQGYNESASLCGELTALRATVQKDLNCVDVQLLKEDSETLEDTTEMINQFGSHIKQIKMEKSLSMEDFTKISKVESMLTVCLDHLDSYRDKVRMVKRKKEL